MVCQEWLQAVENSFKLSHPAISEREGGMQTSADLHRGDPAGVPFTSTVARGYARCRHRL